jgi:NAD-dependent SIR2 family protein deacetylase
MQRQKHSESQHGTSSTESVLGTRSRRLYCEKCQKAVDRRHAVHAGRSRSRCPVCGELLRPTQTGHAENGHE